MFLPGAALPVKCRPRLSQYNRRTLQHSLRRAGQVNAASGPQHVVPADGLQRLGEHSAGGTAVVSPLVQQKHQVKAPPQLCQQPVPAQPELRLPGFLFPLQGEGGKG